MSIIFNNNAGPCPCGSGLDIPSCCLRETGYLVPVQADTPLPGAVTGFANPRCYAAGQHNCTTKLTAEHYFTRSILETINRTHGTLYVGDLISISQFSERRVAPKAAASKVLCDRHNAALSELDDFACKLFLALCALDNPSALIGDHVVLFNGHDVERRVLKALCGYLASGESKLYGGKPPNWQPPVEWLGVLYGNDALPDGLGLFWSEEPGIIKGRKGVAITAIGSEQSTDVVAAKANMMSQQLLLALTPKYRFPESTFHNYRYRPYGIKTVSALGSVTVLFAWSGGCGDPKIVNIDPYQPLSIC